VRLFVAAIPPLEVLTALDELDRPALPGVRWVPPENLHVTLRFLGETSLPIEEVTASLADLATAAPALARIGPETVPLGTRVLCLPVRGLDRLASRCDRLLADLDLPARDRPFSGHMTVARLSPSVPRRLGERLAGIPFSANFSVSSLWLVSSVLSSQGAQYELLAELRLMGR
jgi:2'-5' RNA ligase